MKITKLLTYIYLILLASSCNKYDKSCKDGSLDVYLRFSSGYIIAEVNGGVPPYTYKWNTGETSSRIFPSKTDLYLVKVTDSKGCIVASKITCGCYDGNTHMQDIDGNKYAIIQIGTQCWMAENLKTSKYANGQAIPKITNNSQWASTTSGAWCNYDNLVKNDSLYGKLYNWYAVNNNLSLAPSGWHVPNNAEWTLLINYLGGDLSGNKMKTNYGWQNPNYGVANESSFSGLPGGRRIGFGNPNGFFSSLGNVGYWWTSSDTYYRDLRMYTDNNYWLTSHVSSKNFGCSVRCVRN